MIVFDGKWNNLWKQARHPGIGVTRIRTISELEEALSSDDDIRSSIGYGFLQDKEELEKSNFDQLKIIIKNGIVRVNKKYDN